MTHILQALTTIKDSMEDAVQRVVDDHAVNCSLAVQQQLQDWQHRYPRHAFKAWEAHGLLSFEVSPLILGEKYVEDLSVSRVGRANVISDLGDEARAFLDLWNGMEWRISSCLSQAIITTAPLEPEGQ